MKRVIFTVLLGLSLNLCSAQIRIVGLWQAEQATVASIYHDIYYFLGNGKFIFKPDGYDGLNRVIGIYGSYSVRNDTLILLPEYTEEIINGYPIRSEITTLADTWQITGGKVKKIPIKKRIIQTAVIKEFGKDCILIDSRKFYKVPEN
jgi:hypothetical protein